MKLPPILTQLHAQFDITPALSLNNTGPYKHMAASSHMPRKPHPLSSLAFPLLDLREIRPHKDSREIKRNKPNKNPNIAILVINIIPKRFILSKASVFVSL